MTEQKRERALHFWQEECVWEANQSSANTSADNGGCDTIFPSDTAWTHFSATESSISHLIAQYN